MEMKFEYVDKKDNTIINIEFLEKYFPYYKIDK
jgi:hypothetical protein